ncbi:MAG: hypothetical protein KatS3mg105_0309 [Gemmatales bacterium]|nr:MAG: hypothetical protein KatS3mg105_0309 [Gemmatales bacterium]
MSDQRRRRKWSSPEESQIDLEEKHVEEECLKLLALHQPVAGDLRRIIAALKINNDLERMADLAEEKSSERALALGQYPEIPIPDDLQQMTDGNYENGSQ